MATFSERLNEAMRIRNINQATLCQMTNIPKSAMSQYISGSFKPKASRTFQIASALNVNEAWLMGYDVSMDSLPEEESFFTKEEAMREKYAWGLVDVCHQLDPDVDGCLFQQLQVKDNSFYSVNVLAIAEREKFFQIDQTLTYYYRILKKNPQYIPLIRKLLYILSNEQHTEAEILEKLFGDYDDHYEEMMDAFAEG